ncbi:MAG TPA: hypothetical protein VGA58_10940 [bacterium]
MSVFEHAFQWFGVDESATNNPSAACFALATSAGVGVGLDTVVVPVVAPHPTKTATAATESTNRIRPY